MSVREPRWDIDKLTGDAGEALVRAMRSAVISGTCEVKTDAKALETGNVYVEYECETADGWKPSGMSTTEAASWAVVVGRTVVWMPTWVLRNIAREFYRGEPGKEEKYRAQCRRGSHPTRGVVVPLAELVPRSVAYFSTDEPKDEAA